MLFLSFVFRRYYVIGIRSCFVVAFLVLVIWGAMYWCTYDVIVWSIIFLIQNISQLAYTLYKMRRVRFPLELEDVYSTVNIVSLLNDSRLMSDITERYSSVSGY